MSYIKLSELDPFQFQEIRHSAWALAEEATQDKNERVALANYLAEEAERWASFDEADADDDSYEAIIEEFFEMKRRTLTPGQQMRAEFRRNFEPRIELRPGLLVRPIDRILGEEN